MGRRRVTQSALGEALGLHQMSISRRLNGEVPFDVSELYEVAAFLGVPVTRLLPEAAA
jgi:transcriptional regulator with XRE-family HTH domain